jgi:hypothetical protein
MLRTSIRTPWLLVYWNAEGGSGGGTTPPAGATPPAGGGAPSADTPWYESAGVSADHKDWLTAKQFPDANTVVASYRSLESTIGRNRLAVPKDDADREAYDAIYNTLGRPGSPDDYRLKDGSTITGEAFKFMAPVFHAAGVSQKQAEAILGAYEGEASRLQAARETETKAEEERQIAKLEKEWGSNKAAYEDIASRAYRALGIPDETAAKIEQTVGYYEMMKLFHTIGSGMSEARLVQDGNKGTPNTGSSVQGLEAQRDAKFADPAFMAKYMHHDPSVRAPAIKEIEEIQIRIAEMRGGKR